MVVDLQFMQLMDSLHSNSDEFCQQVYASCFVSEFHAKKSILMDYIGKKLKQIIDFQDPKGF